MRCKPVEELERDICLSLAGLEEIHQNVQSNGFRQDWQKRAIVYASMIETGLIMAIASYDGGPGYLVMARVSKCSGWSGSYSNRFVSGSTCAVRCLIAAIL